MVYTDYRLEKQITKRYFMSFESILENWTNGNKKDVLSMIDVCGFHSFILELNSFIHDDPEENVKYLSILSFYAENKPNHDEYEFFKLMQRAYAESISIQNKELYDIVLRSTDSTDLAENVVQNSKFYLDFGMEYGGNYYIKSNDGDYHWLTGNETYDKVLEKFDKSF
jgi:hypothetical protein